MYWVKVNFKNIIAMLLPISLRKERTLAFIEVLIAPIDQLYQDILYKMQHTCQVIYLEKLLNEHFEVVAYNDRNHENTKAIYITDSPKATVQYIYLDQEIPPNNYLYLGMKYLSGSDIQYDFIVHIPLIYSFEEPKIRAIIDYYKLAGKKYLIQVV